MFEMNNEAAIQPLVEERANGLGIFTCAVFIVGEIAGSGVLALPKAVDGAGKEFPPMFTHSYDNPMSMTQKKKAFENLVEKGENAGWFGLVLIILCCFLSAYTGDILGKCWSLVRERNEQYRTGHVRYPYPAIGQAAFGKFGRYLVSFSINFTLFGVGVVFLLLASENIVSLINSYTDSNFSFCYMCVIVAAALTPVCWLGTPADFWFVAVGATCATTIACVILVGNIIYDKQHDTSTLLHSEVTFTSFFMAFGSICFAFGGHPAFPTFQADMKDQKKFGMAVLVGYLIVLCMYFPVSSAGYFVYGHRVTDNVLASVTDGPAKTIVTIMIVLHLLLGFTIVINPFCQEVEHVLKIPERFNWKRVVSRTCMVAIVLFVAETVPHFGAILSLVGGSTTTLLAYICPPLFYLKLSSAKPGKDDTWEEKPIPLHTKIMNYEIILVGLVAGIASTYSALEDLITSRFTVPCYVDPVRAAN